MASPFVYVPEATPQDGPSPFLPPSPRLYPSSPFLGPTDGASSAPNAFNANSVLWPGDEPQYESAYAASWAPMPARQRTNSWSGPAPPLTSPFLAPQPPAFLQRQRTGFFVPKHRKSNSWGYTAVPPPWGVGPAPQQIHPWLNGDAPSPDFHFDLAASAFRPLRRVNAAQSTPVAPAELAVTAFSPPRTALRILHARLPFWPIDLALPAGRAAPPISLSDILVALHRALHERISHADWHALGADDERRVSRAFTHRCRAEALRSGAPPAALREAELALRSQGVKRVDFLQGKTLLKGLVRAPGDPEGCVRMVTA
ncbi:hypothetical protein GGX14DRAFT_549926 [Mycena pura]|uniref:DUF6699 domain-containing protein n=1 Tax=Mycena pura TaxID=153505 RepID=A0AAD6VVU7_9AGAR|nr:hypothetical protein GGX14DRAFT_549926 [Mycena pura]